MMRLIVDTNIILSALLKEGLCRKIICSRNIEFFSLDYVKEEIAKYKDYLISKTGMSKKEIEDLISLFMEDILIVPENKVKSKMQIAKRIMKDIDIKDAPILACALAVPNDGIWTEDKHFDKQDKVKVWHTKELLDLF